MLLSAEDELISKKQGRKEDAFGACGTNCVKIIFALLIEVVALYMQASIVQVRVFGIKKAIVECEICLKLAIFLALNK